MKFLALCFAFTLCLNSHAAELPFAINAKAVNSPAAIPAATYDPALSVAENNARLTEVDPHSRLLLAFELEGQQVVASELIGTPVQFTVDGQAFAGQISSFEFEGGKLQDSTLRVFAQIKNRQQNGDWLLKHGRIGVISFGAEANSNH
ncbi:hypothetical protein [Aureliella helgolandensis]|uniref:Uncharacterized protein n=1 Tax=Aureliella helgolandensis TaxID=2527968 RepID=A0A518G5T1_9BACT|nr:hypothetical protein [Aureliella helgolandensis]QDV23950.1 hypothetical protein Q31a_22630 [Aureliella helgolandensis]